METLLVLPSTGNCNYTGDTFRGKVGGRLIGTIGNK